jgi:hypothetical protein
VAVFEIPHFFTRAGNKRMFAMLRAPQSKPKQGILICQSLGQEQIQSYRYLAQLARALAGQGSAVMNFDYLGTGNSEGEFAREVRLKSLALDIDAAYRELARQSGCKTFGLLCLGLGLLPGLFWLREKATPISWLLAWAPVLSGEKFLRQARRQVKISRLIARHNTGGSAPQGEFVLEGYSWSEPWLREIATYNAETWARAFPPRNYFFDFTVTGQVSPDVDKMAASLRRAGQSAETTEFKTLPFWKNLFPDQRQISGAIEKSCLLGNAEAKLGA